MKNSLEQLKQMTTVVADTGDFASLSKLQPVDATTNPSLILQAANKQEYHSLLQTAISQEQQSDDFNLVDRVLVLFGCEILKVIPGRVSTEIDAELSYDIDASVQRARQIIRLYRQSGVSSERVLIKLASTWQGIQAAKILEEENIHCNLTLLFSLVQAKACADAGVTLISPFVGRILDWYKQQYPEQDFNNDKDPGVISVSKIYRYYKQQGVKTQIMGASFRNVQEIIELAGCDLLTISPALLSELQAMDEKVEAKLSVPMALTAPHETIDTIDENNFHDLLEQDIMASEKLVQGIESFVNDQNKLKTLLSEI